MRARWCSGSAVTQKFRFFDSILTLASLGNNLNRFHFYCFIFHVRRAPSPFPAPLYLYIFIAYLFIHRTPTITQLTNTVVTVEWECACTARLLFAAHGARQLGGNSTQTITTVSQ